MTTEPETPPDAEETPHDAEESATSPVGELTRWFVQRLPDGWFDGDPVVRVDKDEILIVGTLAQSTVDSLTGETDGADGSPPPEAVLVAFRKSTRKRRMEIAEHAQMVWQRKVSWGAVCGDVETHYTTAAVPVMTRLRLEERQVLDTLIDAGVARSRSEALSWCVQQVGRNQQEWINRLKDAMSEVERIRREGPA